MFIHSHKLETLEQASRLAQDIKTSLRFSSERKIIPKTGDNLAQTLTPLDLKDKSVIGESFKNAKGSQYFK